MLVLVGVFIIFPLPPFFACHHLKGVADISTSTFCTLLKSIKNMFLLFLGEMFFFKEKRAVLEETKKNFFLPSAQAFFLSLFQFYVSV